MQLNSIVHLDKKKEQARERQYASKYTKDDA